MNSLIIFIILSSSAIYTINAEACTERQCHTALRSWCCAYSATCGSPGVCNITGAAVRTEYCPGSQTCISYPYYWCCSTDQTCGGYATCKGGSVQNTLDALKYVGIAVGIFAFLCGLCCGAYRHQQRMAANNGIISPARNQGVRVQPYSVTNWRGATTANPPRQPFAISPLAASVTVKEETPPPYDFVTSSSTRQEESTV